MAGFSLEMVGGFSVWTIHGGALGGVVLGAIIIFVGVEVIASGWTIVNSAGMRLGLSV